ncbi:hypothetical protein Zmor_020337 [Zophobas morio]|uniref:Serpin domain-containing protein n=1 Tax=Zophobas morio TaxID=2755281 RepID=A0AA38I3N5_9CUCU|nr:hypothetical protein Zmor_020337 [Zophobas morio]
MKLLVFLTVAACSTHAEDISGLVNPNVRFSGDLYDAFAQFDTTILGPFSIQAVVAVTESGTKDTTAKEIMNNMLSEVYDWQVQDTYGSAMLTVPANITTKMFSDPGISITDDYKETESTVYGVSIENMEFSNAQIAAANLNHWLQEQTSVTLNTLFKKITWANPFPADRTVLANYTYYNSNGRLTYESVYMMTQEPVIYNYYESTSLTATFLEVPFEDPDTTLTIVLPDTVNGLSRVEQRISDVIQTQDYIQRPVQLSLPRFQGLDGPRSLKEIMQSKFNVNEAFGTKADLSGIAGFPGDLAINDVLHSSYITFGEDGVEAVSEAAVTTKSFPPRIFEANHPFLFYIKYKGVVLFIGKYVHQ